MQREHYLVDGLGNSDMKTQVKNAVENIDGVNGVCIDLARGSVEVMYNSPATPAEIKSAIENTGHRVR